ncbi:MAG: hypothetical protein J7621_10665 [Niastella sp.]|nr:hypothetical protein [Niastella sp.]
MSFIRRIIRPNSFLIKRRKYILTFLNGFLLACLFYFYIERQYENNIFTSLAAYIQNSVSTSDSSPASIEDSLIVKSVHLVHSLGERRMPVFGQYPIEGVKANFIQPVTLDLMTAQGACGSHAYVLGRLLQELNMEVRFPQMTVEGRSAGHIVVEAKTSHGWVALDPLSDVFFRRQDGRLAAFNDVKNNWNYYQQQLPPDYDMSYRYEGVRYTNWDKIPVIMPLIKNIMYWTMGKEKTDSYSLRSLGLKKYNLFFNITLGVYLLVCLFTINLVIKARRKAAFTNANLFSTSNSAAVPAGPTA